ncbi:hypothetical protein G9A89_002846 [Geosiphon pyriformis]|nr:hypothetical protein G9A89_002846 [Geosiphon pyriformis]
MGWELVKTLGSLFSNDHNTTESNNQLKKTTASKKIRPKLLKVEKINLTGVSSSQSNERYQSQYTNQIHTTSTLSLNNPASPHIHQNEIDTGEFLFLQLPEEVKLILEKIREIQRTDIDKNIIESENQSSFATLESALMSILILVPTLLLTNSNQQSNSDNDPPSFVYSDKIEENYGPQKNISVYFSDSVNHHHEFVHTSSLSPSTISNSSVHNVPPQPSPSPSPSPISSKSSYLVKILGASTLLISIIHTILTHYNELILINIVDPLKLEEYNLLTECVEAKADAILKAVQMIKDQSSIEKSSSNGQTLYQSLVTHSDELVDALTMFMDFVKRESPLHVNFLESNDELPNTNNNLENQPDYFDSCHHLPLNNRASIAHVFSNTRRKRTSSFNSDTSDGSNISTSSSRTLPVSFAPRTNKNQLGANLKKSTRRRPFPPLRIQTSLSIPVDLCSSAPPKLDDIPGLTANLKKEPGNFENMIISDQANSHEEQELPIWRTFTNSPQKMTPTNSKFREQLDGVPPRMPGLPWLGSNRRRLSDLSSTGIPNSPKDFYNHGNRSAKSTLSAVETSRRSSKSSFEEYKNSTPKDQESRRLSNSSIKSYFLKHVHSTHKKKVKEDKKSKSFWPVNESKLDSPDKSEFPHYDRSSPTSSHKSNRIFSFVGKRPKSLHKISSESDLRITKKKWADREISDTTLSPHVEDAQEEPSTSLNPSYQSSDVNNNVSENGNLRENLFHKLKKLSASSLLKAPSLFSSSQNRSSAEFSELDGAELLKYCKENSKEGLQLDIIDKRAQVVSGTVENLITWMVQENSQDLEFIDCFILCHVFFMDTNDFLENLILRFHLDISDEKLLNAQNYVQMNVLTILHRWVSIQPDNFRDEVLCESLENFLVDDVKNAGFLAEADQIAVMLKDYLVQETENSLPTLSENDGENHHLSSPSNLLDNTSLLDFNSKDIAKHLTMMDFKLFQSIQLSQYISGFLLKRQKIESGEEINKCEESPMDEFTRRANRISHWVATEICRLKYVKGRKSLVQKFIEIAKYCRDWNNFNTAMFIVLGLNSLPVRRLLQTWELVPNRDIATMHSIEALLDNSSNMNTYRSALGKAKAPVIPFLPLFLKDLVFLFEGNPTWKDANSSQPMVNMEKFHLLTRHTQKIKHHASEEYHFETTFDDKTSPGSPSPFSVVYTSVPHLIGQEIEQRILIAAGDAFGNGVQISDAGETQLCELSKQAEP